MVFIVKLWSHFDKNERHKTARWWRLLSWIISLCTLVFVFVSPLPPICWWIGKTFWQVIRIIDLACGGDHASAAISMDHLSPSRRDTTSLSQRELMLMFCVYCFWCFLLSAALYWGVTVPDGELARLRDWTWQGYTFMYKAVRLTMDQWSEAIF